MFDGVFDQARHADGQSVVLQQRAARERGERRAKRLGEDRREAIVFRRHDEQSLSGDRPGQKGSRVQRQAGSVIIQISRSRRR